VRDLRTDRGPVLLITALHRDFASTDTLAALAIADVGVALDDPQAATPWTADIITGTDLAAAVRILSALPVAREATESAVRLAKGGSTLAGLLLVTGDPRTLSPFAVQRRKDAHRGGQVRAGDDVRRPGRRGLGVVERDADVGDGQRGQGVGRCEVAVQRGDQQHRPAIRAQVAHQLQQWRARGVADGDAGGQVLGAGDVAQHHPCTGPVHG
ncbi:hypothetical protein, partial [Mycobacterium sp. E188]|uniref:hypothetical protein n=1 Tax=Mycobacterium sp. E188 TaxID=1834130 RepID=UPI0035121EC8